MRIETLEKLIIDIDRLQGEHLPKWKLLFFEQALGFTGDIQDLSIIDPAPPARSVGALSLPPTSVPFDPRSAPSPTPSGSPSGCCQSSLECPHRPQSCAPDCLLLVSLPRLAARSSSDGIHNCTTGSPPRKSALSQSSPPSAPLDPAPSVSPMAAASHLPSVCIAASPAKDDIGLPQAA